MLRNTNLSSAYLLKNWQKKSEHNVHKILTTEYCRRVVIKEHLLIKTHGLLRKMLAFLSYCLEVISRTSVIFKIMNIAS